MDNVNSHTKDTLLNRYMILLMLTVICFFAAYAYIKNSEIEIVLNGFTPITWIDKLSFPDHYARDFENGTEVFNRSAFLSVYRLGYDLFKIQPENLLPVIIAMEVFLFACAIYVLTRVILPGSSPAVGLLLVALSIASDARDMDLARFGQLSFIGHYYIVADVLRIFGLIAAVKRNIFLSSLLLAGSFITHAQIGLFGCMFVASMLLYDINRLSLKKIGISMAAFIIISAGWVYLNYAATDFITQEIPAERWFAFGRFLNYHWYPVDLGIFTTAHADRFIPFLSLLLLFTYYISRNPLQENDKKIIVGVVAMLSFVIAGVVFSVVRISPFLIKLSLHRANDIIIILSLVYVVHGLYQEIIESTYWRKALAATILVSPFFLHPGFPLLLSMLIVTPAYMKTIRGEALIYEKIVTAISISSVALVGIYVVNDMSAKWTSDAYTGGNTVLIILIISGILLTALHFIYDQFKQTAVLKILLLTATVLFSIQWLFVNKIDSMGEKKVQIAKSYKQAQLWASDHTPPNSLFMTDPAMGYSWRDYSRRSSFGTLREWLHTWLPRSSESLYQEGMIRFAEFGLDINDYLHETERLKGWRRLIRDVRKRYYSFDDPWRANLSRKYGIDYFVLRRDKMITTSKLPVAYENDHFIILKASPQQTRGSHV